MARDAVRGTVNPSFLLIDPRSRKTSHIYQIHTLCISPVCWRDFPLVNSPAKEMVSSLLLAFLKSKSLSTYSETLLGSLLAKAKKLLSLCVHLSRHCSIT